MAIRKVKGISFTEKDFDVLEHLESQANQSRYVIDLIRKDMKNSNDDIEKLVKKYIEKYIGEVDKSNKSIDTSSIDDILNIK